jgi:hypothetical protein
MASSTEQARLKGESDGEDSANWDVNVSGKVAETYDEQYRLAGKQDAVLRMDDRETGYYISGFTSGYQQYLDGNSDL